MSLVNPAFRSCSSLRRFISLDQVHVSQLACLQLSLPRNTSNSNDQVEISAGTPSLGYDLKPFNPYNLYKLSNQWQVTGVQFYKIILSESVDDRKKLIDVALSATCSWIRTRLTIITFVIVKNIGVRGALKG